MKTGILDNVQRIVTSGLEVYLDAGNPLSYPGSGTDWFDISGNNYDGTLTNGASYSSSNGGVITFDGTDDYIDFISYPSLNSSQTKSIWVKANVLSSSGDNRYLIDWGGNVNWVQFYSATGQPKVRSGILSGNFLDGSSFVYQDVWYNICVTSTSSGAMSIYINSALDASTTGLSNNSATGLNLSRWGGNAFYLDGSISIVQIYNRELTSNEVLQNFNTFKSRYGL
jgi:hypothetical protein